MIANQHGINLSMLGTLDSQYSLSVMNYPGK